MQMVKVESSQIEAVGHDPEVNILVVQFKKNNAVYEYQNVTAELHKEMMEAPSIGSWFSNNIKKNPVAYPYQAY